MNFSTAYVEKVILIKKVAVALVLALLAGCGSGSSTTTVTQSELPVQTSASISWTPPSTKVDGTSLTGAEIGGYLIIYGTSPGVYTSTLDVGNVTSYDFEDVASGSTYYVVVVAYDTLKDLSDYSEEIIVIF